MSNRLFRKTLSAPGLLREVRSCFDRIEDTVANRGLNLTGLFDVGAGGVRIEIRLAAAL